MNLINYLLVVLIWGTTWIALKWQLGVVPIPQSIAYRFVLASACLFVYAIARGTLRRPRGMAILLVGLQGICLFCVNFICFLNASLTVASGLIAVVFSTASLWNALLARILLKRPISLNVALGGSLGLLGLLLLFWPQVATAGADATRGLIWALCGTLCFSSGNLLSTLLQARGLRPLETNAWGMAFGASILLASCFVSGQPLVFDPQVRYVAALLYLAIPGSVIAFTAYLTLVGRLGPERAAYCTVLFPIVALNVSAVFEAYQWDLPAVAGLALVVAGNLVVFRKPREVPAIALKAA